MSLLYCHQSFVYGAPPNNKRMPAHRWSQISTVSGHFTFSFDSSESIRLVVFAKPTIWLHNRLMPNQSTASSPPIAGQCHYPLKVLYTIRVALQGKTGLHTIRPLIHLAYTGWRDSVLFFTQLWLWYHLKDQPHPPREKRKTGLIL